MKNFGATDNCLYPVSKIIFQRIKVNSKVLDVGCGTGELGSKLKTKKDCFVAGIEINGEKMKLAKDRLDEIIVANIEELRELPFPKGYFDAIVFADVLEHLKDPERALTFFREYLKEGGSVFVSIPNVANWILRAKLLFGKWNYQESGLLDKRHLRFFTLKTAKQLIEHCGYRVVYLTSTSVSRLDKRLTFKNPANLWKSLLGWNLVFETIKTQIGK